MQPQQIVEDALSASGADGCIVIVAEHSETNLRWAGNNLTTNGQMQSRSVTVISTLDTSAGTTAGVVTRSVTTPDELTSLVREADEAAHSASPSDDAAPLVANYRHDDDWNAEASQTSVTVFEQFAPALGTTFDRWRKADELLFGFAEHQLTSTFLGLSTGLRRRFDQPAGRLELNGKSADLARSAWSGMHTRTFADVDIETLAAELETRLEWAANRVDLPAGRFETILPPTAVADLMIYAYWTAAARDAEEGRSVFAAGDGTRIGERLATLPLTLRSDPAYPGLQCAPFEIATQSYAGLQSIFDNGEAAHATDWLRDGTLMTLARTRNWAARTNTEPQPLIGNLIMQGGKDATASMDDMIAGTERGLLVTCLWYIREVDPQTLLLTGLTRDGVYLIENGAITGAVNNFRFNESPIDLLRRATEASTTVPTLAREWSDYFQRTAMPALRIPDFNMSTVSAAL